MSKLFKVLAFYDGSDHYLQLAGVICVISALIIFYESFKK